MKYHKVEYRARNGAGCNNRENKELIVSTETGSPMEVIPKLVEVVKHHPAQKEWPWTVDRIIEITESSKADYDEQQLHLSELRDKFTNRDIYDRILKRSKENK